MNKLSIGERTELVKYYYIRDQSPTLAVRSFMSSRKNALSPTIDTVRNLIQKFERTGSVSDEVEGRKNKEKNVRTPDLIEKAIEIHEANPQLSVRELARELDVSASTAFRIRRHDLGHFAYKISTFQALNPNDTERRLGFAKEICSLVDEKKFDPQKIIFTDEAHFHLDGYVDKQNYRIWGTEKPSIRTKPLHPRKLTVWAGIFSKGILGPIFLKENETIDGRVYSRILHSAIEEASKKRLTGSHFRQQDGAPPHRTGENLDLIHSHFKKRAIAKGYRERFSAGYEWPPFSPDLPVVDFYLWGFIKDSVYKERPGNLEELRERISDTMHAIPSQTLQRAISAFEKRLRLVIESGGEHFEDMLH